MKSCRDFPGGPMVKTLPSNAGDVGLIPGREAKIPYASLLMFSHSVIPNSLRPHGLQHTVRNINNLRYADDITLMPESEEN